MRNIVCSTAESEKIVIRALYAKESPIESHIESRVLVLRVYLKTKQNKSALSSVVTHSYPQN